MKPHLFIDVGNTQVKWADISAHGAMRVRGSLPTKSVAKVQIALAKNYARHQIVVASVVPRVTQMLRRTFPKALFVHGALRGLPLAFDYPKPVEIGADRIAAAIGAKGRGAAIVVSCGTATAFSAIDKRGRFCGGAIAPGLDVQMESLLGATAQLPATKLGATSSALARSTQDAIRAGVFLGWQGGVREIVLGLRKELGTPARLIVTGGAAEHLRSLRGLGRMEFRPLLVFEGLRIIADTLSEP
jgi:type III pantothenate kinase